MEDSIEKIVMCCYRKYKTFLYYSKGFDFMKLKLVDFESNPDFQTNLKDLATALRKGDYKYFENFIKEIKSLPLPKAFSRKQTNDLLVSNIKKDQQKTITKLNFFIELPIQLAIVDVLFTLFLGKIDAKRKESEKYAKASMFFDTLFNNNDDNDQNLISGIYFNSGRLFKRYFEGYCEWRNGAIKEAENLYDHGKDSVIYSLDLDSYFYNINIDLDEIIKKICTNQRYLNDKLLQFVVKIEKRIFKFYKEQLSIYRNIKNNIVLPIGLPSSSALSNLYLREFDNACLSMKNVKYYSRYVDDILIVITEIGEDKKQYDSLETAFPKLFEKIIDNKNEIRFHLRKINGIEIQKKKIKIIKTKHTGPKEVLNQLDKKITNSSEVRLLSNGEIEMEDLVDKIHTQTVDKLKVRDAEQPEINIKNLTSCFSNYLRHHKNTRDITPGNTYAIKQLSRFFTCCSMVELYSRWPLILQFVWLVLEKKNYENIFETLESAIKRVSFSIDKAKNPDWELYKRKRVKGSKAPKTLINKALKEAMDKCFKAAIGYAEALKINKDSKYREYQFKFRQAMMFDMKLCSVPLLSYCKVPPDNLYNQDYRNHIGKIHQNLDTKKLQYSPTFIYMSDSSLATYIDNIKKLNSVDLISKIQTDYHHIYDIMANEGPQGFCVKALKTMPTENNSVDLTIDSRVPNKEISILLANINLDNKNIITNKKGKKITEDRSPKKKKELLDLLRQTTQFYDYKNEKRKRKNIDFLVMPEAAVPFEWLPELASVCRQTQMAIITGLEYIILDIGNNKKRYINSMAVILPFQYNGFKSEIVIIREKNDYAPDEIDLITNNINNGETPSMNGSDFNYLFTWRGIRFASYICYELTDILFRGKYRNKLDIMFGVEWNKDVDYFKNIIESISRDLCIYTVQVNSSKFGETRIVAPMHRYKKYVGGISGGDNDGLHLCKINIDKLNEFKKNYHPILSSQERKLKIQKETIEKQSSPFYAPSANSCVK